jgi:hypothetical protein
MVWLEQALNASAVYEQLVETRNAAGLTQC